MELNKEIVRQLYIETASKKKPTGQAKPGGGRFTQYTVSARPASLKTFQDFFGAVSEAFPDYELTLDNLIVKGDRVMARYTICGTHMGLFMGLAPTNERMTITGIDIFRLDKGQVIQHWDAAHQICAFPQMPAQPVLPSGHWHPYRGQMTSQPSKKSLSLTRT